MVDGLAQDLAGYLVQHESAIEEAHVHGAQSSAIQTIVSELLRAKLGFKKRVLLTADMGVVTRAQPDFYYPIGQGRGILAEVKRGRAITTRIVSIRDGSLDCFGVDETQDLGIDWDSHLSGARD